MTYAVDVGIGFHVTVLEGRQLVRHVVIVPPIRIRIHGARIIRYAEIYLFEIEPFVDKLIHHFVCGSVERGVISALVEHIIGHYLYPVEGFEIPFREFTHADIPYRKRRRKQLPFGKRRFQFLYELFINRVVFQRFGIFVIERHPVQSVFLDKSEKICFEIIGIGTHRRIVPSRYRQPVAYPSQNCAFPVPSARRRNLYCRAPLPRPLPKARAT